MTATAVKSTRKLVKSWVIDKLFSFSGSQYQRDRFPQAKFELITGAMDLASVGSVLDVGCNEGYVTSAFSDMGKFCVGIDVGPYYLNHVLNDLDKVFGKQSPAFGVFPLSDRNVDTIPEFDVVLLLSVHHQLVKRFGEAYARDLVTRLAAKARRYLVIEFSATADKYGFTEARFVDNDEASVKAYADAWLRGLPLEGDVDIRFLGKNKEYAGGGENEPYRYVYMVEKRPLS